MVLRAVVDVTNSLRLYRFRQQIGSGENPLGFIEEIDGWPLTPTS